MKRRGEGMPDRVRPHVSDVDVSRRGGRRHRRKNRRREVLFEDRILSAGGHETGDKSLLVDDQVRILARNERGNEE